MREFPLSLNLFLWKHTHTHTHIVTTYPYVFHFHPILSFFQEPLLYYQFSPLYYDTHQGIMQLSYFHPPFPKGEIHNIAQRVAFVPWALQKIIVKCLESCVRILKFILNSQHSIIMSRAHIVEYCPPSLVWHVWEMQKQLYYRGVVFSLI
jgi:hypothetical protein